MSDHSETISTVVGVGVGLTILGGVAVRVIVKPLRRVASAYESFMGDEGDPKLSRPARPGVMPRLDSIDSHLMRQDKRLDDVDRGNVYIIAEQRRVKDALAAQIAGLGKARGQ